MIHAEVASREQKYNPVALESFLDKKVDAGMPGH
jgi:hypothetical protein